MGGRLVTDRVLIVDDEKNIRLTLSQALSSLAVEVDTAEDGQQALSKVQENGFALVLLDLQMPGIDGLEVLRRLRDERPEIPVIIITAHGNIESAVEAVKLGAIEFLPKPFVPDEIRALVSRVLDRHKLAAEDAQDYATCFELAKRCISERHLDAALEHLKRATGIDPERPEAFNLIGVIHEVRMKNYRVAYHSDPTYTPANENLNRAGNRVDREMMAISLGDLRKDKE
jgi:DNA-binding response OmpR family regulator